MDAFDELMNSKPANKPLDLEELFGLQTEDLNSPPKPAPKTFTPTPKGAAESLIKSLASEAIEQVTSDEDEMDKLFNTPGSKRTNPEEAELTEETLALIDVIVEEESSALGSMPGMDVERLMLTQAPVVKEILKAYVTGKKAFILEAPTGSGKTIIAILALNCIMRVAKKLRKSDYYELVDMYVGRTTPPASGYFLTSSKTLQDQLDKDINRFGLRWSLLKGQSNYICNANNKTFPERECIKMSLKSAAEKLPCAEHCQYIQKRLETIASEGAVLSYAYWLISMNFIYDSQGDRAPFAKRLMTVFDECHLLSDIVQDMFSIRISEKIAAFDKIEDLCSYIDADIKLQLNSMSYEINQAAYNIFASNEVETVVENISAATSIFKDYLKLCFDLFDKKIASKPTAEILAHEHSFETQIKKAANIYQGIVLFLMQNYKNYDNLVITEETTERTLYKRIRTLDESTLVKSRVHKYTGFSLFMSATIGDIEVFARNAGIENYDSASTKSDFLFKRSQIFKFSPMLNMGNKHKRNNMRPLMQRIIDIAEKLHPNERGIVHTGNFEIAKELRAVAPKRFKFYSSTEEKQKIIELMKSGKPGNEIIVGPSLIEGIDLNDDSARFAIIAKVPYPYIDEFASKKMKYTPGWYEWKTLMSFLQSIGRPIRHKDDWAITYLMDECFNFLFSQVHLPEHVKYRIQVYNGTTIINGSNTNPNQLNDDEAALFS